MPEDEKIESILLDSENLLNSDYINECYKRLSIPCKFVKDGYKYKISHVDNPCYNLYYIKYDGEEIGGNLIRKYLQLVFDFNADKG